MVFLNQSDPMMRAATKRARINGVVLGIPRSMSLSDEETAESLSGYIAV
jgi:hypothetical protein